MTDISEIVDFSIIRQIESLLQLIKGGYLYHYYNDRLPSLRVDFQTIATLSQDAMTAIDDYLSSGKGDNQTKKISELIPVHAFDELEDWLLTIRGSYHTDYYDRGILSLRDHLLSIISFCKRLITIIDSSEKEE